MRTKKNALRSPGESAALAVKEEPATLPILRLHHVTKAYETATGPFLALKGVTVDFHKGEFVGIIGKSGAGKSTLANMITGVDRPTSGEIWAGDIPLHAQDEDQLTLWRGHNIGVVYQSFELLPQLSLLDNILLPMDFCGLYHPRESQRRAQELLTQVGLEAHMHKTPSRISGGQQQRVAIARALANDPSIIVADEPTGNLDSKTAETIFELFVDLAEQGKTIIMITHDASWARRFGRVLQIVDGALVPL